MLILAVLYKHRLVADDLLYILTTKECVAVAAAPGCLSDARASNKHEKLGRRAQLGLCAASRKQRGETKRGHISRLFP